MSEVKRVASILGVRTLSKTQFDSQTPQVKAQTVATLWGGWEKALEAAGLNRHPLYYDEIPLTELADDFLNAVKELNKIPTIHQLSRRSTHGINNLSRKGETSWL
ncbi:homing endonuclease associated repeat-containing protein [Chloroflexota bacterium]